MRFVFPAERSARLDEILRTALPSLIQKTGAIVSNSKIRRLIVAGEVFIGGVQRRQPARIVRAGEKILVNFDDEKFFFEKQNDDVNFTMTRNDILFEDDLFVAVDKPADFPSEPVIVGGRNNMRDEVARFLWSRDANSRNRPYVGAVHRLDRTTSGVMLFAKTRAANAAARALFESRAVKKIYGALVTGSPPGDEFSAEGFIGRVSAKSARCKWGALDESRGGVFARSEFSVKEETTCEGKKVFALECRPLTGRTHQLRVQLSQKGCPIFGDTLYGGIPARKIYLRALSIEFTHPATGEKIFIQAKKFFE